MYLQAGIRTVFDGVSTGALNRIQTLLQVLLSTVKQPRAGVFVRYNDFVMEWICLTEFFGFLQCRESTCSANFDLKVNITMNDISFDHNKNKCTITFKAFKD